MWSLVYENLNIHKPKILNSSRHIPNLNVHIRTCQDNVLPQTSNSTKSKLPTQISNFRLLPAFQHVLIPNSKFPIPRSKFQIPNSKFQFIFQIPNRSQSTYTFQHVLIPNSKLRIPNLLFQIPNSTFQIYESKFPINHNQPTHRDFAIQDFRCLDAEISNTNCPPIRALCLSLTSYNCLILNPENDMMVM